MEINDIVDAKQVNSGHVYFVQLYFVLNFKSKDSLQKRRNSHEKKSLPAGADKKQLLKAIKGHIIGQAQLMGKYKR